MTQQNNTIAPVGRILIAVLSLASGIGKLAAPAPRQGHIAAMGLPAPVAASLASMAGETEMRQNSKLAQNTH